MLRVYLDQNKWIDLARAATGNPKGERFRDALDMCRAASASKRASFPLDIYRYWETTKRADDASRNQLVDIMWELSRGDTLAQPFPILDKEIDEALQRRFGVPADLRPVRLFGKGVRHIANGKLQWPDFELPEGISPGLKFKTRELLSEMLEETLLRAGPKAHGRYGMNVAQSDFGDRFVEYEESLALAIEDEGVKGAKRDDIIRVSDLRDILPAVVNALSRAGIEPDEFLSLGKRGLIEFVDDLPTRYVTNILRRAKHIQRQQPWERNDFIDIVALPVPAVYCDVVVTEKQWVHHLHGGRVDERFGTQLLSDTAKLTETLVAASLF
ncbi:hypothetical protein V4F30_24900 [Rhodococcus sp. IITD102]|uniref:hypothetical protein n=1 Tax=Rhodococcus TaxID=1827 RepID=UPI000B1A7033|nr:hypothetical protein [Rhodococcus ruber]WKK14945.1 hypothetical protein QYN14_27540 [Rhodococcus ruber]